MIRDKAHAIYRTRYDRMDTYSSQHPLLPTMNAGKTCQVEYCWHMLWLPLSCMWHCIFDADSSCQAHADWWWLIAEWAWLKWMTQHDQCHMHVLSERIASHMLTSESLYISNISWVAEHWHSPECHILCSLYLLIFAFAAVFMSGYVSLMNFSSILLELIIIQKEHTLLIQVHHCETF